MSKNRQWLVLSLVLMALGALISIYKVFWLGFPSLPDRESEAWTVQVRIELEGESGAARVGLMLPSRSRGFTLSNENFISRGFGLTLDEEIFHRRADWAVRSLSGSKTLYYRASLIPQTRKKRFAPKPSRPSPPQLEEPFASALADIVADVRNESADTESFAASVLSRLNRPAGDENLGLMLAEASGQGERIRLARTILAGAGIASLELHGIMLDADVQSAPVQTLLAVHDGSDWLVFDPRDGQLGLPETFLIWWRGEDELVRVSGADLKEVQISVRRKLESALEQASKRASLEHSAIARISVLQLPVQTQSVYELLLLVPFGILVIVVLRNFVGFSSFGTFAPVLIALAFRETELFKGIMLFVLIVSLGLFFRFYLERLRLLLVPRLAAVVTIVVLLMTTISIISQQLGAETGLSVSLFPMVIISMVIERMSVVWEERGAATSIREGLGSLLMAALAYLVISLDLLAYWVSVFPEVNLVVLGVIVALGRYTGFRLTELLRFRSVTGSEAS